MNVIYKKQCGIYKIKCLANGKFYIGSTNCIYTRWHTHVCLLRNNKHTNIHLQRAVNKYGIAAMVFGVIEFTERDNLIQREQYWLDTLQPSFNICKKAESTIGIKLSDTVRQHLSNIRKGRYPQCIKGANHTPEARKKISEKAKERFKKQGGPHPNLKMASIKANTGRKHSVEEIEKRAEQQKKITPDVARFIKGERARGVYQKTIAKSLGISQRLVCRVEHGVGVYGTNEYLNSFSQSIAEPLFDQPKTEQGKLL